MVLIHITVWKLLVEICIILCLILGKYFADCTITLIQGEHNLIVDTGLPIDKDFILQSELISAISETQSFASE